MIIDMHIHPFCKESNLIHPWGDNLDKVAEALLGKDSLATSNLKRLTPRR